jgi:hypothetical protein
VKSFNYLNYTTFCTGIDGVWFPWMELLRICHMLQHGKKQLVTGILDTVHQLRLKNTHKDLEAAFASAFR